jgi:hypothetical protein
VNRRWCELLRGRHVGERAVLVCNGPSLRDMDLTSLRRETVIGLNKIHLGLPEFGFYPRYLVAVNRKVLEQSLVEIQAMACIKFLSNHRPDLYQDGPLTHVLDTHNPPADFCTDITVGLHEGWTVTFAALQVAYFMGFKQVVIIGMDHRYSYAGEPNAEATIEGEDPNHFHAGYFGHGQKWDNPDLENSERSYRLARRIYEQEGREIVDATLGGACEVFRKADYRQVLAEKYSLSSAHG